MQPTIGQTVIYTISDYDAQQINQRRADAGAFNRSLTTPPQPGEPGRTGHMLHTGNGVREGSEYPAVVVAAFNPSLNLHVLLDGNDTYWATSRLEGTMPGSWHWPERV